MQNRSVRRYWLPTFYFLYFGAGACVAPFISVYLRSIGLGPAEVGVLVSVTPVMMLIGAPVWSGVADAFRRHRPVIMVAIVGAAGFALLISRTVSVGLLFGFISGYAFFNAPIMPIADNATLGILGSDKASYGRIRLWGGVAWGIIGPIIGVLADHGGLRWPFYGYAVLFALLLAVSTRIPLTRLDEQETIADYAPELESAPETDHDAEREPTPLRGQASPPRPTSPRAPAPPPGTATFWEGVRAISRDPRWYVFLGAVFTCGIALSAITNFLFLYMQAMGASPTMMGISLAVATVAELPFFVITNRIVERIGSTRMFAIGMAAFTLRFVLYWAVHTAWAAIVVQVLHGISFVAIWVSGVSYADTIAPRGVGATAQSIFGATLMGLGAAVGGVVSGALFGAFGGNDMYGILSILVFAGLVIFWGASRRLNRSTRQEPNPLRP